MTVKEMMQKLIDEDANDIDFCDDYDESAMCAYCLTHWSPEAEKKYARAFGLTVDEKYSRLEGDDRIVIVHCEDDDDVDALHDLLYAMAGYIGEKEYDMLFPDPPKETQDEEHTMFEVVLVCGKVIKASRVDMEMLYRPSAEEISNPNTPERNGRPVPGFAIYEENGDCNPYYFDDVVRIIGEVK